MSGSTQLAIVEPSAPALPNLVPLNDIPHQDEGDQDAPLARHLDPRDAELAETERLIALQDAAPAEQEPQQTEVEPAAPERARAKAKASGTVPLPRFNQVNDLAKRLSTDLEKSIREAEYWRGVAEGQKNAQAAVPPAAQPAPAPVVDPVAAAIARLTAEAERFDAAEITMPEFIPTLVETILALMPPAAEPAPARPAPVGISDKMVFEQHIQKLRSAHPWARFMNEAQERLLRDIVLAEAVGLGEPIDMTTPEGLMLARERVAQMTDVFGPRWNPGQTPDTLAAQAPAAAPQGSPANATTPRPTARSPDAKMALAEQYPPNINQLGRAGDHEQFSDERLAALTPDEWSRLPKEFLVKRFET